MRFKNILMLAGGNSTRFWPLTEKNLTQFLGKPLIEHQLLKLNNYCDNLFIVVNGSNIESIKKVIKDGKFLSKTKIIVQEKISKGQAGAVLSAQDYIRGEVLILNANDIFDYKIFDKFLNSKNIILLAKKIKNYFPGGYLRFEKGKVKDIIEKPEQNKTPSDIVKLVADYLPRSEDLFSLLKTMKTDKNDLYEKALSQMISNNETDVILYHNLWLSLKYPWHIFSLMNYFLDNIKNNINPTVQVSKNSIIEGFVQIRDNVRIGDFVKILGPVYIGENTIVGDHTLIRNSHIGKNCLIGSGTEITRSYIGNNVKLHRNYVGDSILANNILMGAGAVTANFRFDEKKVGSFVLGKFIDTDLNKLGAIIGKNSKIGVNATILPGKKIAKDSIILPGKVVDKDIKSS